MLDKSEQVKKTKAIRDNYKMLKSIRNLFRIEKGKGINDKSLKDINDKILRDIRTLYESDKEDYYKPIRIGNAFSSNCTENESNGDKDKILSIKEYLDMIRPYLNDLIDNNKTQGEWKIQLTITINFASSKDSNEIRTMHTKSDNIEIMIVNETDEVIKNFLNFFCKDIKKD